jgi:hypothetical protein
VNSRTLGSAGFTMAMFVAGFGCLLFAVFALVVESDSLSWRIGGWMAAGIVAPTLVASASRLRGAHGRSMLVGLVVALNSAAVVLAVWHALFVFRRLL